MPDPPTALLNNTAPALANTFKVLLFDVETAALTVMLDPVPSPLTPEVSAVESNAVLDDRVMALPNVIAPAVRMLPLKYRVLGADIVSDPSTVNTSAAASLIVNVPVLLNVRLYELEPTVPMTEVPLLPVLNTRLYAVPPVEILATEIAPFNVIDPV